MSDSAGLELLVATGNQSFTATVSEELATVGSVGEVTAVDSADPALSRVEKHSVDGVVIDDTLEDPVATADRLTSVDGTEVVLLTDGTVDTRGIETALEAGVTDVFPRTTASTQYELIVDRIENATRPAATADGSDHARRESERRLRAILERIDEAVYVTWADELTTPSLHPDDFHAGYEDVWGRSLEEIFDTHEEGFFGTLHPEERDGFRSFVADVGEDLTAGSVSNRYSREYRIERADGSIRWIRSDFYPTEWGTGPLRMVIVSRDITERKRREQEYELIFNAVKDAILVIDPETLDVLDANEAYLDLVGYDDLETVREVGVEGMVESHEGSTVEQARRLHERVVETGESELVEWRAETSEGDRLRLEIEISPAVINGERVSIAIHRDVTERRQLERRFRTIGERVEEVIYFSNIDLDEVLYINDAYTDIWGRPVEEIYENPRAFVESIHPDDVEAFRETRRAMLEDIRAGDPDDSYDFSYRIERPDGERRWIESTGYPIVGEGAEPNRYVAMVEDVTEQHRREQTLETFHEATRKLTAADSHEHACQQAVQAAQDVLGFPLVAAYLYDDETGTLKPAARTDRLETLEVDLRPFGPGDSLPWQVFVEGESITDPDRPVDTYGPGVSPPDVIVPLGSYGVMFVGAPGKTFGSEDIELARILAATLEAALNHVAGEQTLAEREKELRRQQERAARLERLNAIIRDIEQVTVEQSSRSGIESAVCERLIDVDTHELVWIGERTVGDEELRIRDSAGDKNAYVDGLSAELASETAGHPAVAVRRNDEVRVVENVATDVSPGGWRTMALRHGIQSVVAVPIRHETTLHGVLTVASGDPDAFDEATRDVLAELGRSIGYAITVTEREKALESEGTTELEFDTDDDGLLMIRSSERTASEIRLERTVRRSGGSFSMFYRVEGADPSDVADRATATPSVENAQVVSTDDDEQRGLVEVTAPTWFGSVFTEHGAVVREATAKNGAGTILVELPRGADVRSLVDGFQERYPGSDLAARRQRERAIRSLFELEDVLRDEVTDRQWEALETAYSAGYFAWPRETSGEGVAELIGVTQPTFNKHLRIAERAAFRLLLEREYPDGER
jgi:PAS domain S-box-containing protein